MQIRRLFPWLTLAWAAFVPGPGVSSAAGAAAELAPAWENGAGYRFRRLTVAPGERVGFTLLPPEATGVRFTNSVDYDRSEANQNLLNGAGVAAGDYDGDGWCDLYFCNTGGTNGLFRNLGGFRFEEVTAAAGVGCVQMSSKGVVFADVNGDDRLDLVVNSLGGPHALLINEGGGRFADVTAPSGISSRAGGHSHALADLDGDGDLDLYLANYGENSILRSGGQISVRTINGRPTVTGRYRERLRIVDGQLFELGEPDVVLLNDGRGNFTPLPWTGGAFLDESGQPLKAAYWDMGLSVMLRDLNGDRAPDIYVCNDFQCPDRIWINDGRGRFRAMAADAIRHTSHFSMGVDVADINRDGLDDIFVGDMLSRFQTLRMTQFNATNPNPAFVMQYLDRDQVRRNTLLLNRGDGTYAEIGAFAGVDASDWSWSVVFQDVDLDGYEDLLVVNGHAYDTQSLDMHEKLPAQAGIGVNPQIGKNLKDYPPLLTPNFLFRNRGDLTFEEVGARWGFHSTNVTHGLALVDLDQDGDQDVVASCLWKAPLIYRNESTAPRVAVQLRGKPGNRQGIGALVRVRGGAVPEQHQEILCGGRYLSADEPMRVFAAGKGGGPLEIEVLWRSGLRSLLTNAQPNRLYEFDEAAAVPVTAPPTPAPALATVPWFADASALLAFTHEDPAYEDFQRQPLLPRRLSGLGPAVASLDLDGDGYDELVVGAGRGSALGVYSTDGKGGVQRRTTPGLAAPLPGDVVSLAGWTATTGSRSLLAGVSSYEEAPPAQAPVWEWNFAAGIGAVAARPLAGGEPGLPSPGPVITGDWDGDGDLDVFVGGRVVPGRYPEPAASRLYRNEKGRLVPDPGSAAALRSAGLVSGAVFSDLTGDGRPELVLALEWGPIRVWRRDGEGWSVWDAPVTLGAQSVRLSQLTGWWNSVTAGDVDGDGRLDLVAGNWGWNSSYRASFEAPVRIYYGDLSGRGTVDLLEARTAPESGRIVPFYDLSTLSRGLPTWRERFPNHVAFAPVDVAQLLGGRLEQTPQVQAAWLASTLFLNRGDRFEAMALPGEAQFSPVFGVTVADWNGDGLEDVYLAQNFAGNALLEPRLDAGRGLWLVGTGDGRAPLRALSAAETGVRVQGDQRGAVACDFDADGRVDLLVGQNRGAARLIRNQRAEPGLRVRLIGPPGNPLGLGAVLRVGNGPARELHGGSGFGSQDSPIQVMARPTGAAKLSVYWPGGVRTEGELPPGAAEVTVDAAGQVQRVR